MTDPPPVLDYRRPSAAPSVGGRRRWLDAAAGSLLAVLAIGWFLLCASQQLTLAYATPSGDPAGDARFEVGPWRVARVNPSRDVRRVTRPALFFFGWTDQERAPSVNGAWDLREFHTMRVSPRWARLLPALVLTVVVWAGLYALALRAIHRSRASPTVGGITEPVGTGSHTRSPASRRPSRS